MKNKEKYNLNDLVIEREDKYVVRVFYKGVALHIEWDNDNKALLESLINWLEQECHEPILNEKEKEYLSAVIKPWRDRIISIVKKTCFEREYIIIIHHEDGGCTDIVTLPYFKKGAMYKGMESSRDYTLEDLGL